MGMVHNICWRLYFEPWDLEFEAASSALLRDRYVASSRVLTVSTPTDYVIIIESPQISILHRMRDLQPRANAAHIPARHNRHIILNLSMK